MADLLKEMLEIQSRLFKQHGDNAMSDLLTSANKRIAELEKYNLDLAMESQAKSERIEKLEKLIEVKDSLVREVTNGYTRLLWEKTND